MRILNETEMSVAAGGMSPIPLPPSPPIWEPPEVDDWWIRMSLLEPEICDHSSHEDPCI